MVTYRVLLATELEANSLDEAVEAAKHLAAQMSDEVFTFGVGQVMDDNGDEVYQDDDA